ncbi:MAG: [Clostridia bacterium]|nr:[FeFe] hydrogenase H-cluster maturation GTPase HydF [Clostridia bacterium]
TTDTVQKAMELLPLGPVVLLDTPGLDDEGELGLLRVKAAYKALAKTDLVVFVTDAAQERTKEEEAFLSRLKSEGKPTLLVYNKCDLTPRRPEDGISVSAESGEGIDTLKAAIAAHAPREEKYILRDLVGQGDVVLLVTPIDASAPKGRIILPQQQTLRELLDLHAIPLFCQPEEVGATLAALSAPPRLVVTDSQAFSAVARDLPEEIALTSFSILFARYKGDLPALVRGAAAIRSLSDGAKVLVSEGCSHHRQCGDIGTVKLPAAIRRLTEKELAFSFTQGGDFPEDLTPYSLVIHCGGCMLPESEVQSRAKRAASQGVPMTNYGIALALASGILPRALKPLGIEI